MKLEEIYEKSAVLLALEYSITQLCFALSITVAAALNGILKAIDESDNATKIKEARETAGNDMIKRMQFVFPIVMMLQMEVIKDYGFSEGRHGK